LIIAHRFLSGSFPIGYFSIFGGIFTIRHAATSLRMNQRITRMARTPANDGFFCVRVHSRHSLALYAVILREFRGFSGGFCVILTERCVISTERCVILTEHCVILTE